MYYYTLLLLTATFTATNFSLQIIVLFGPCFKLFSSGYGHLATLVQPPPPIPTCTLSPPVLARPAFLAVPAPPALNRSGLLSSHQCCQVAVATAK